MTREEKQATGLCRCGCGRSTPLAKRTDKRCGLVEGQPVNFIRGHQRFMDRTGQKFGALRILEQNGKNKYGQTLWKCRCECGNESSVTAQALLSGNTASCGHCPNKFEHQSDGTTIIFIERKGELLRCTVDTTDYPTLKNFRWSATKPKKLEHTYYARSQSNGKGILMHRLLLPETEEVDHIDFNGLNNRRSNLRPADRQKQVIHRRKQQETALHYKGVIKSGSRFRARITVSGQDLYLGGFASEQEAARAYDKAAKEHFKDFAVLNFPDERAA